MDLARAPRRAPLTARKKGSGYENGLSQEQTEDWALVYRSLSRTLFLQEIWRFLDKK